MITLHVAEGMGLAPNSLGGGPSRRAGSCGKFSFDACLMNYHSLSSLILNESAWVDGCQFRVGQALQALRPQIS